MLAIGDELLSGRTKDRNVGHLAEVLTLAGIDLKEVRIVGDEQATIVEAVNALRKRYAYIFTSGGIGPTHDDITADAIAAAFGVEIGEDERAIAILEAHYAEMGIEFTQARRRMARVPVGADLIENTVSKAPGFRLGNVHVMAGVPSVFQAMLDRVMPTLKTGARMLSASIDCPLPEGAIASALADIQARHGGTSIGSYPRYDGANYSTQIVIRSRDAQAIAAAESDVRAMLTELNAV
jgi:molybdenum cofactor synthesis domain-containing protein